MWNESDHILYNDHDGPVLSLAFSPDGSLLASGDAHGTVKLWDMAEETLIVALRGHTRAVWSVAFAPDGGTLASGSHDGTVRQLARNAVNVFPGDFTHGPCTEGRADMQAKEHFRIPAGRC